MPKVDMTARREALRTVNGREIAPFDFGYEWTCQSLVCDTRENPSAEGERAPARLFIRSRADRAEGPSNYDASRQNIARPDLKQQPSELNWNGLAEERGWTTAPVVMCPACQVGMTVAEYKRVKRQMGL